MKTFGNMMKRYREELGLTQAELAKRVGISRPAISMYEGGLREPDFETEEKICLALDDKAREFSEAACEHFDAVIGNS